MPAILAANAAYERGHTIGLAYLWGRDDAGDPVSHDEISAFAHHYGHIWRAHDAHERGSRPPVADAWHQWRKAGRTDQQVRSS